MSVWEAFFESLDETVDGQRRADLLNLLHRNFRAAGNPEGWHRTKFQPGFRELPAPVQQRLKNEFLAWRGRS